jgi:putative intracellular protease/amidase
LPPSEADVKHHDALVLPGTVVDEPAVIDRGIITSRKPEDLDDFVAAIASQLA